MKGVTRKKISVIIPAYNVEKYMRRCLDSLINQTYENIEIIVVNDGSTDGTQEIVEEYVEQYPGKIMLFSKENEGQAEARNYGLTKATGEYIGFVDSDDFVATQMYEKLYCEAEENHCDLVTCGYYGCDDVTGEITVYQTGYRGEFNQSIYENPLILRLNSPYPWNKLYTRELLDRAGFQFKKGMIFEDLCAIFPLFLDAKKVGRVHEKLYYYIKGRPGGTISTFNEKHGQILDALRIMNDAYQQRGMFEKFYDTLLFFNIRHIYARFEEMNNYEDIIFKREFKKRAIAQLDQYFPGWMESREYQSVQETAGAAEAGEEEGPEQAIESQAESLGKQETKVTHKTKGKRRSEIFEELVQSKPIVKNQVLIECYRGNDLRGMGSCLARSLARQGEYKIYIAAADELKLRSFVEIGNLEFEYVDMNTTRYLEILATAEYVVNNRAFPGFYRKRKGQRFLFVDFLPSPLAQGTEVTYGAKDIQGMQLSLAQADRILFPEEGKDWFMPLLERYHMETICRDKGWFVPGRWILPPLPKEVQKSPSETTVRIAYVPSVKEFPGLKDAKCHLFLSDLKKKLTQLDEQLLENERLCVCFPRLVRRRFKENIWKHVEFVPEDAQPLEVVSACDGMIGEYDQEMYWMKALGKPVCCFVNNQEDIRWSKGLSSMEHPFEVWETVEEVLQWIHHISAEAARTQLVPSDCACLDLQEMKPGKNRRIGKRVLYLPKFEHRRAFMEYMDTQDVEGTIFFIEKEFFTDALAAWIRQYKNICYMVIIRSIVVSKKESRKIKYHITTKDKLKEKRDRERYLG